MRPIPLSFVLLALSATAGAHTLATDESLALQLGHQVLGLHHLPLTALLLIGGIVFIRRLKNISHD